MGDHSFETGYGRTKRLAKEQAGVAALDQLVRQGLYTEHTPNNMPRFKVIRRLRFVGKELFRNLFDSAQCLSTQFPNYFSLTILLLSTQVLRLQDACVSYVSRIQYSILVLQLQLLLLSII